MAPADEFEIEFRWKEEVVYWEGKRGFLFDGGWGVDPLETYGPSSNAGMPSFQTTPGFLPGDHRDILRD